MRFLPLQVLLAGFCLAPPAHAQGLAHRRIEHTLSIDLPSPVIVGASYQLSVEQFFLRASGGIVTFFGIRPFAFESGYRASPNQGLHGWFEYGLGVVVLYDVFDDEVQWDLPLFTVSAAYRYVPITSRFYLRPSLTLLLEPNAYGKRLHVTMAIPGIVFGIQVY